MEAVNGVSEGGPPPPSPLTGCYLLIVIGEPHSQEHKDIILRRVAKGLLSWDISSCLVDLEKELAIITEQAPDGEEARYGERLIQYASENLVTEILIHPAVSTLSQCVRNLLSSFTRHRHIIHSGYTFAANGSWALQDGTFSLADFSEAFQELEVQRVIRAYENSITVDIHCAPEGDWLRLPKEPYTKNCIMRLNPVDVLPLSSPSITNFLNYISPFLITLDIETALESSEVVGNIRFSHPTLYVFPGGQGDAALFGINGFNMLLDGGFSRKACFWDFVRHLDRLDAVLLTRLNNSNVCGISSVLRRKRQNAVYPQIGHFFSNIQERKALSPDGDKDKDPLIINLLDEGQDIVTNLKYLNLSPQSCYRDSEPINLYHKVGHGTLDMYVLNPAKESKEVKDFLQKWNNNDSKLFSNIKGGKDFIFPLSNLVSVCALLVWQPSNPSDNITRILFPGSTPQGKIFEGLDKLRQLECIKYPVCSEKSLNPPTLKKTKESVLDKIIPIEKAQKILPDAKKDKISRISDNKQKSENKQIDSNIKNGTEYSEMADAKIIKKSESTESDKSSRPQTDEKVNGKTEDKQKPKTGKQKKIDPNKLSDRKPKALSDKKASPTTPKKTMEKINGDTKENIKAKPKFSPSSTPAKSTKEATNRKVFESKKAATKKESPKPAADKKEAKADRKPISRRPKPAPTNKTTTSSPVKKVQKPDSIAKKAKLDKEGTTDSSTVSTPSADQDNKRDLSKLTAEEIEQLKAQELADLKEEQEVVQEIEAVFRKGEKHDTGDSELRKIKNISIEEKTDEEYLIVEKEIVEADSTDKDVREDEIQKLTRDSEESEKQRKLSIEDKVSPVADGDKVDEKAVETVKELPITSPVDKLDSEKKIEEEGKDGVEQVNALESQPDEKFSATIESGATTAPTLPEDERIPLDEIKEDIVDQAVEEKHVKEETKEKEVPLIQLPSKTFDQIPKLPPVVGIRLDKQSHIRDIVKTPDEVADLPVHEVADHYVEFQHEEVKSPKDQQEKKKTLDVSKAEQKDAIEITEKGEKASEESRDKIEATAVLDSQLEKPFDGPEQPIDQTAIKSSDNDVVKTNEKKVEKDRLTLLTGKESTTDKGSDKDIDEGIEEIGEKDKEDNVEEVVLPAASKDTEKNKHSETENETLEKPTHIEDSTTQTPEKDSHREPSTQKEQEKRIEDDMRDSDEGIEDINEKDKEIEEDNVKVKISTSDDTPKDKKPDKEREHEVKEKDESVDQKHTDGVEVIPSTTEQSAKMPETPPQTSKEAEKNEDLLDDGTIPSSRENITLEETRVLRNKIEDKLDECIPPRTLDKSEDGKSNIILEKHPTSNESEDVEDTLDDKVPTFEANQSQNENQDQLTTEKPKISKQISENIKEFSDDKIDILLTKLPDTPKDIVQEELEETILENLSESKKGKDLSVTLEETKFYDLEAKVEAIEKDPDDILTKKVIESEGEPLIKDIHKTTQDIEKVDIKEMDKQEKLFGGVTSCKQDSPVYTIQSEETKVLEIESNHEMGENDIDDVKETKQDIDQVEEDFVHHTPEEKINENLVSEKNATSLLEEITNAVKKTTKETIEDISEIKDKITGAFKDTTEKYDTEKENVIKVVSATEKEIDDSVGAVIEDIKEAAAKMKDSIISSSVDIKEKCETEKENLIEVISDTEKDIKDSTDAIINDIAVDIKEAKVKDQVESAIKDVKEAVVDIKDSIISSSTAIKEEHDRERENVIKSVSDTKDILKETSDTMIEEIKDLSVDIKEMKVEDPVEAVIQDIKDKAIDIKDSIIASSSSVKEKYDTEKENILKTSSAIDEKLKDTTNTIIKDIKDAVIDMKETKVEDSIGVVVKDIKNAAVNLKEGIISNISTIKDTISEQAKEKKDYLIERIQQEEDNVDKVAEKLQSHVTSTDVKQGINITTIMDEAKHIDDTMKEKSDKVIKDDQVDTVVIEKKLDAIETSSSDKEQKAEIVGDEPVINIEVDSETLEELGSSEKVMISSAGLKDTEFIDKADLGRKSPKEREQDVAKIVASVAEVLKSEAPLEEFEGKIPLEIKPFSTFTSYTTELRETHITTVDSPTVEMPGGIGTIHEEEIHDILEEEEEATDKDSNSNTTIKEPTKISELIRNSNELLEASSKMIKDIKSSRSDSSHDIEKSDQNGDKSDSSTVHRMLVTASSEDGGEETILCPAGSIKFSKSVDSSGRTSPELSKESKIDIEKDYDEKYDLHEKPIAFEQPADKEVLPTLDNKESDAESKLAQPQINEDMSPERNEKSDKMLSEDIPEKENKFETESFDAMKAGELKKAETHQKDTTQELNDTTDKNDVKDDESECSEFIEKHETEELSSKNLTAKEKIDNDVMTEKKVDLSKSEIESKEIFEIVKSKKSTPEDFPEAEEEQAKHTSSTLLRDEVVDGISKRSIIEQIEDDSIRSTPNEQLKVDALDEQEKSTTGILEAGLLEKSGRSSPSSINSEDEENLRKKSLDVSKADSLDKSGKSTPGAVKNDMVENIERISSLSLRADDTEKSGKSTPDSLKSDLSEKSTTVDALKHSTAEEPGILAETLKEIEKPTKITEKDDILEKSEIAKIDALGTDDLNQAKIDAKKESGRATPDSDKLGKSGKLTPDALNREILEKSGKSTPEYLRAVDHSGKSTPDMLSKTIPDDSEDSLHQAALQDASPIQSGKSTPDKSSKGVSGKITKDVPVPHDIDITGSGRATPDKITETQPISGKSTPDTTVVSKSESKISLETELEPKINGDVSATEDEMKGEIDMSKISGHHPKDKIDLLVETSSVSDIKDDKRKSTDSTSNVDMDDKTSISKTVTTEDNGKCDHKLETERTTIDPAYKDEENFIASRKSSSETTSKEENTQVQVLSLQESRLGQNENDIDLQHILEQTDKSVKLQEKLPSLDTHSKITNDIESDSTLTKAAEDRITLLQKTAVESDVKTKLQEDISELPTPFCKMEQKDLSKLCEESIVEGAKIDVKHETIMDLNDEEKETDLKSSTIDAKDKKQEHPTSIPIEKVASSSGKSTPDLITAEARKDDELLQKVETDSITKEDTKNDLKSETQKSVSYEKCSDTDFASSLPDDVSKLHSAHIHKELLEEEIASSVVKETVHTMNGDVIHDNITEETCEKHDSSDLKVCEMKDTHSGKSSPEPLDSRKSSMLSTKDDFDSRKFSITSENTKTSSILSGRSTPEIKEDTEQSSRKSSTVSGESFIKKSSDGIEETVVESSISIVTSIQSDISAGPSINISPSKKVSEANLSGKSTPDIADIEKIKEMQEILKHEKHIPGSSTPPTVPVSPIVKDITVEHKSDILDAAKTVICSEVKSESDEDIASTASQVGSIGKLSTMDQMNTSIYGTLPSDEPDIDYNKAAQEHQEARGESLIKPEEPDLMTSSFIGILPSSEKDEKKDKDLGKPLGLPSPAPPNDNKGTPKKERKLPVNVTVKNKLNDDRKRSESPKKQKKVNPVYVDLTYVPHHGNSYYTYVDFFRRVRARYYVFSGIEPSKEVYNALLEAKQQWEDKDLEVTIIPTYDTDVLGYWVAENEELLTKHKIDLSPSASRCTINLQDHETSCSAYRLEF